MLEIIISFFAGVVLTVILIAVGAYLGNNDEDEDY